MLPIDRGIRWAPARVLAYVGLLLWAGNSQAVAQDVPITEVAFVFRLTPGPVSNAEALPPVLRQRFPIVLRRVSLERALREIAVRTQLDLSYSRAVVPVSRKVSVDLKNGTVAEALRQVLSGVAVEIWVTRSGKVALVPMTPDAVIGVAGAIIGRVTDGRTGRGVAGAEVFLEKTRWRTATDSGGRYQLAAVDTGTYTVMVRRLGYAKHRRQVAVRERETDTVDVALEPVATRLDELVTTATGQQRRRDLGNDITMINADSVMHTAPIRNLTDLLENRVPGLTVQHTSGAPGDPAKLRLLGLGSILRSNDPVVYVDGMRLYSAQSDARSGNLTNLDPGTRSSVPGTRANPTDVPAPSPLDQIDPNIIEKIEIFKGPSAATLYGADAANGVIVITTKRGKPGPTRWEARLSHGRTSVPSTYPVAYFRWGHELFSNRTRFCTLRDRGCVPDSLVTFQALNQPNLTVLDNGHLTNLSLTASGGTQALTYAITGSYGDQTGTLAMPQFEVDRFRTLFNREPPEWMRRPLGYKSWSVTSNVTARLSSSAEVTLLASLSRDDQRRSTLENQLAPLMGTYIDTVNALYYQPSVLGNSDDVASVYALNPTASFLQGYYTRQTASSIRFATSLGTQWRPRAWFSANGQAGIDVIPNDDQLLLPAGLVAPTDSGSVVRGNGRSLVSSVKVRGTLLKPIGWGFMFVTNIGADLVTTNTADLVSSASGLIPGTSSLSGARRTASIEQRVNTSVFGWYIEPALTGRRLSLSAGLRIDGGSAYGTRITSSSGGLLGGLIGLPKLNASWVISEEPWFPFTTLFSSLRLRGSYGRAQVQPNVTDRLRLYTGATDAGGQLLTLTTLGNTALKPERSTMVDGGFDADLLDNRVSVGITLYRKLQLDALQPVALPGSVNGGGTVMTNIGNINNTGFNVTLGVTPVRSSLVTWSAQLLAWGNKNELIKLGQGVASNKGLGLVEGFPLYSRWARPILGFVDQNGDGVLQPEEIQIGDSLVYMGRLEPASDMALNTNLALFGGKLGLTADIAFSNGATQIDQTARRNWVLVRALVDPTASLADQAAVLASTRVQHPTDYGLMHEFSTVRFSSFSVNYRAPRSLARLVRAQQVTFGLQGKNLGLHSTYSGGRDPDVSAWAPGESIVDTGQLPQPRIWQLSASLSY